jgi:hypothetical protein
MLDLIQAEAEEQARLRNGEIFERLWKRDQRVYVCQLHPFKDNRSAQGSFFIHDGRDRQWLCYYGIERDLADTFKDAAVLQCRQEHLALKLTEVVSFV